MMYQNLDEKSLYCCCYHEKQILTFFYMLERLKWCFYIRMAELMYHTWAITICIDLTEWSYRIVYLIVYYFNLKQIVMAKYINSS